MNHRVCRSLGVLSVLTLTAGCASITGTTNQNVSVQTREQGGREVTGAACELTNNKGKWFVTTPGSTGITRSNDDLQVLCNKTGYDPGRAAIVSVTKGSMFGNIIFGGGIGAIVDHNSGAAYEYPSFFQVVMGMFTRVEPPPSPSEQTPGPTQLQPQTQPASMQVPPTTIVKPQATEPKAAALQPAAASRAQVTAPTLTSATLQEEKLRELKRLNDAGLISQEIYLERQRKIFEDTPSLKPTTEDRSRPNALTIPPR